MNYLVDANVLSEPTKPEPDARVVAWLKRYERDLVVDPVILGELRFGILLLPRNRGRNDAFCRIKIFRVSSSRQCCQA